MTAKLPAGTGTLVTVRCNGRKYTTISGDRVITCYTGNVYNYTDAPVCEKIGKQ